MNYPVICLKPKDLTVYWFANEDSLKTADKGLILKGVFDDVLIIDSDGRCYSVKGVRIIGWATPFWGYSIKRAGRSVKIEFDLETDGDVSLDQLKEKLADKIGGMGLTRNEIEVGFTSASSISQVINFFK